MSVREFPAEWKVSIDAILESVQAEKRQILFEHEIYRILSIMDIRVPTHRFVPIKEKVTAKHLALFKEPHLMVKVVSPQVLHKGRVNGVRKVAPEPAAVNEAIKEMTDAVASHPSFTAPPEITGFLLTGFVEHSQELGHETLISMRENLAFGPVISFAKGGRDAEHFAKNYSPPNLGLTPLDIGDCRNLLDSTKILSRYVEEGRHNFIAHLTDTIHKFSLLATYYSSFSRLKNRFVINELEVNPFVFDMDGKLVALDGLGSFMKKKEEIPMETEVDTENMKSFFQPRGVAVAGISANNDQKMGNIIASLLHAMGRKDLFLLNPKGGKVDIQGTEYPLHASMTDVKDNIDLVIVTVPAKATEAVVADAAAKGVKGIILIPGGFSEVGMKSSEERLLEIVKGKNIRLIGPNCLGVFYNPPTNEPGINCVFVPKRKFDLTLGTEKERNVALITQSGGLGVSLLDKLKYAISPRVVVSYGNQIDVGAHDLAAYFDRDPDIDVIALYIEGYKTGGGRGFFNAVKNIQKPVIVYKAGRTDAGSRAAASHTASMAGDYEVARAAFQQAGLIIAESITDFADLVKTFALLKGKRVRGRNVAGVVNAGFESTYAADNLGGLSLSAFAPETEVNLKKILPPFVGINPFMDLTPMGDDVLFERVIQILLEDPNVDNLLISMVPHTVALHTTPDEIKAETENVAHRILRQYKNHQKPIVVSILAGEMYSMLVNMLEEGGVPAYSAAEKAMDSLNEFVSFRMRSVI